MLAFIDVFWYSVAIFLLQVGYWVDQLLSYHKLRPSVGPMLNHSHTVVVVCVCVCVDMTLR